MADQFVDAQEPAGNPAPPAADAGNPLIAALQDPAALLRRVQADNNVEQCKAALEIARAQNLQDAIKVLEHGSSAIDGLTANLQFWQQEMSRMQQAAEERRRAQEEEKQRLDRELTERLNEIEQMRLNCLKANEEATQAMQQRFQQELEKSAQCIRIAEDALNTLKLKDDSFSNRVSRDMSSLSVDEVIALFNRLRIPVAEDVLRSNRIDGLALADLQPADVQQFFGVRELGTQRRLCATVQALRSGHDLNSIHVPDDTKTDPVDSPYNWNVRQVLTWLDQNGLTAVKDSFERHQITGDVMMHLSRDDMTRELGIVVFGQAVAAFRKITELRKTTDSGLGAAALGSGSAEAADLTAEDRESIRREFARNGDFQDRLRRIQERMDTLLQGDTREVPAEYKCPITQSIMEDPVTAGDGISYERVAIEAWLHSQDTSPMTRRTMPRALIPNNNLRSMIRSFVDGNKKS